MDKVEKLYRKIPKSDRQQIKAIIFLIEKKKTESLDVRKLEGLKNQYRVRVGKYRVIFRKEKIDNIILGVSLRNEKTYNNLS